MSTNLMPIDPKLASVMDGRRMTFLDIETTGRSIIKDRVIALGVAVLFPDGRLTTSSAIFGGGSSCARAFEVHKIPDSARMHKRRFEDDAHLYARMFEGSIIVGHNARAFDIPLILAGMKAANVWFDTPAVLDTLRMVRRIGLDKVAGGGSLGNLCAFLNIPYGNHDALGDALSAMALFTVMVRRMDNPVLDQLKAMCA